MTRTTWALLAVGLVTAVTAAAFETIPILAPITDKTLVVWCSLDTLDQRGGSVFTLEKGDLFDGLVVGRYRTQAPGGCHGKAIFPADWKDGPDRGSLSKNNRESKL